jgi:hypothetical protein
MDDNSLEISQRKQMLLLQKLKDGKLSQEEFDVLIEKEKTAVSLNNQAGNLHTHHFFTG